jgi:hypothetical protein
MLEVVGTTGWIIASLLGGGALVLAARPTHTLSAPTTPHTPLAATSVAASPSDTGCTPAMPSDGAGGCYALVTIEGVCGEPINSIVDHYTLFIAGSSRTTELVMRDMMSWRDNDRFLAHLRPARAAARALPAAGTAHYLCGSSEDDRPEVLGMVPLDPEDLRTVAEITAAAPDLWSPHDPRWQGRARQREMWIVVVTSDRRWDYQWLGPNHGPLDLATLGPVPATAEVGAAYAVVGSHDEQPHVARRLRSP